MFPISLIYTDESGPLPLRQASHGLVNLALILSYQNYAECLCIGDNILVVDVVVGYIITDSQTYSSIREPFVQLKWEEILTLLLPMIK